MRAKLSSIFFRNSQNNNKKWSLPFSVGYSPATLVAYTKTGEVRKTIEKKN